MKFMLDTNICIELIRRRSTRVLLRLQQCSPGDVGMSSITLAELEFGVHKSRMPDRNKLALAEFAAPLEILPFDDLAAASYGELRARLERQGQPIGSMDMLIAAHALSRGLTLVTNNEREFRRVPGLRVTNWAG